MNSTEPSALKKAWGGLRKPVFIPASIVIFGMIGFAVVFAGTAEGAFESLNSAITDGVGWWYILSATGFVAFALYCGISRVGNIRLGRDDEKPEFGVLSWFAMLFSAGMGIGLVFYGVAEPLSHYVDPPEAGRVAGSTDASANQAMELTLYHWGLHAWAIYVVVGLGMAYMTYRKGRPLTVRWILEPLLGRKRIEGGIGHAIDAVAIIGTLFGVATSLGFGVQQISAGLEYLGWIETNNWVTVILIAFVTALATFSVVTGVSKGLKWLSNINMAMAASLALFVLILGPTLFLMQSWVQNLGGYIQALPELMLRTAPFADDGWAGAWTIFYWGWWMSWAPFVGMFIARISRGRTIREFVFGVLLAPTVIGSLWFTIFGDAAILRQRDDQDLLVDGEVIDAAGVSITVLSTPGHTADSLSFVLDDAVLTGDTILGRGTTVLDPQDGSLGDYLTSLDRLEEAGAGKMVLPGHGAEVPDTAEVVRFYRSHRLERLAQVKAALDELGEDAKPMQVVKHVYADVDKKLWPAARMSVKTQLAYLRQN